MDQPGHRRLARGPVGAFVEEEVVRWLCDLAGYGEGSFGLLTSGGVMANFIAMALVRDVHLRRLAGLDRPPRARRWRACASTPATRRTSRSRGRWTSWASRPRRWSSCPPTTASACTPNPWPRPSRATGPGASARRDRRRRGLHQHGLRGPRPGAGARSRRARASGSTWTPRTAGRPASPPATPAASPAWSSRTASPSTRTSGSSRPTTSARWSSGTAPTSTRRSTARPSTTAAARGGTTGSHAGEADAAPPRRPRRPAQLLQAGLRGHPPVPRPQAVGQLEAPRHVRLRAPDRAQRRPRRLPRRPLRRGRRPRGCCPQARSCPSSASATCRAGRPPRPRWTRRRSDAHQDRLAAALEASGDGWLSTTTLRGRTYLRAGIVNYLTTEADIDRLLATLRELAAEPA